MDELNSIGAALTDTAHLSMAANERCSRLNSCQSPDQFFINMVNEFLNDDTTTAADDVVKTTPLNIEYLEEPADAAVASLLDFDRLKTSANSSNKPTSSSLSSSSASSSSPSSDSTPVSPQSQMSSSPAVSCSSASTALVNEDTRSVNPLLLTRLSDNLPRNVKEISYQRFGRFNTNLPAEVHNFKCHLCAFSCAWKEILLQHFQEKHPT